MLLEIRKNTATYADIYGHLLTNESSFVPHLSSYVNIKDYAKKLSLNSKHIELWSNTVLHGLLAYYYLDKTGIYFISNFSLSDEIQGGGWSKKLLDHLIADMKSSQSVSSTYIRLEVFKANKRAIKFYEKFGFNTVEQTNDKLVLNLIIKK